MKQSQTLIVTNPLTKETWIRVIAMEFGNIAHGHKAINLPGTNNIFFLDHDAIKNTPKYIKITFACIIVDYRPQNHDLLQVRIKVGGILII